MDQYTFEGTTYNVAPDRLEEFKQKFPQATKVQDDFNFYTPAQETSIQQAPEDKGFVEDLIQVFRQSRATGGTVDEAYDLFKLGGEISDDQLQAILDARNEMEKYGPTNEQFEFAKAQKKYGGGITGTLLALKDNPGFLPQLLVGSAVTMATSLGSDEVRGVTALSAGAGAATGGGTGAALTSFSGPGALFGAGAGAITGTISGGIGGLVGSMETGLTLMDLIQEELGGAKLTKENIRSIINDTERFEGIKQKAVARGRNIGLIEAMTFGISRGVGAGLLRTGRTATAGIATTAIEGAGGFTGEVAGQIGAGQDVDLGEATLEAIGEFVGPEQAINLSEVVRSTIQKSEYAINNERRSKKEVLDLLNSDKISNEEKSKIKFDIKNDEQFAKLVGEKLNDIALETQIDSRVSDVNDRNKLVDLQKQRAKAEADTKKTGIFRVVDADAKLESIDAQIDDIINKYSNVDRRTKDVRARKATAERVRENIADKEFKSNLEFAKKHSKLFNLTIKDDLTTEQIKEQYGEEASQSLGFIENNEIIINSDVAKKRVNGRNVANHELLHGIINIKWKKLEAEQRTKLANELLESIGEQNRAVVNERVKANYDDAYMQANPDEYVTIISDGIANKTIKFDDSIFTRVKDYTRNLFQSLGVANVDFETSQGVYNFLKDYNRSIHKGALASSVARAVAGDVNVETRKLSKEASDKVQNIYEQKGAQGAFEIINEFKPIVNRIVDRRKDAPNFDRQLLTDEIETGQRGILDLISEYKPDSGVPLAAFINKFLPARAIEASRRVLGEEFTADVTEARGVIAEETAEVEVQAKPRKKKIVLAERLGVTKEVDNAIRKIVPDLDIENLTFKSLKNKIPNVTGKLFGIAPKKIESLANLTKKELQSAQMFINKNADLLITMLPEGATPSGTATGVPNTLLKAFYTKTDRAKAAATGSRAGLAMQQKNNINKKDFLETFGIIDGKPDRTDRNTSARVLALANLTGKMITNQAVRTEIAKTKADTKSIKKIAEGKSETMFSKDVREFNIGGTIDNLLGTHKDKVGRKTYKLKTEDDVDVYIQALIDDVLPLMPRDFWFGTPNQQGVFGSEFTPSNRVVDNKKIYRYYQSNILALNQLPDEAFGKPIGVTDFSRPAYKTLFEGSKGVQIDKINDVNKRSAKIHEALWSRIYDAIQEDPTKAAAIGNYFKIVSKKVNHWHRFGAEIIGYSKNPKGIAKKLYEYEHAMPATASYLYLLDAALKGYDFKTTYGPVMDNYKLIALDAAENKKLNAANLGSAMPEGWNTIDNNWWERYFNDLVDIDPSSIVTLKNKTFKEEFGIPNFMPNLNSRKKFSKSVNSARQIKDPKGITVLDFDDTLATTKSLVRYTGPDGETGTLNAEQYANTYQDLLDQGYTFDFSEFNKVVKGKIAPLFQKALKLQNKFGPSSMFVLTARPPQAQKAIFDFLKANGLNIPLKNITGLGNSTAEAKALWIADKVGEGFNDFYFADDALQNVQAVKNMLDQFDVKSKVQQAKLKFSKDLDGSFNSILEDVTGIEAKKRFDFIKARKRGASKGKFRFFIPPSHEDFVGLLYNFMGKGTKGDAHRNFFEQALVRPLNRANREYDTARQSIATDYRNLNKQFPDIRKMFTKSTPDGDFTYQDAIRVYLWDKHGYDIPGLSPIDQKNLVELVKSDAKLNSYANAINDISRQENYVTPTEGWDSGDIRMDLDDATGRVGRAQFFAEFNENAEVIFSTQNLNKIEAGYGKGVREALEDMLYRIKTGRNRPSGQNKLVNGLMNYLNGSVGSVMFFNMRSALLQQMSLVNYLNFADNNIFAAAKAFADQKQYWADWSFIFNSDMLKQRRGGIQTDVNGAELAAEMRKSKNPHRFLISKLLQLGFLPTQIGDNIAIATGGATYYRNRINKYLKDGLSKKEAESKAFTDFQDITQSTQQSARPDMVSQQQASVLGKVILNFQNVTSQFNRLGKKAFLDIKNRRITKPNTTQMQSDISNAARITYYFAVQNAIFYTLQTALFAMMFGDDEDDNNKLFLKKQERLINGSIDSVLRGTGVTGAVIATLKNTAIAWARQRDIRFNPDESAVLVEALNFSPVVGIKARKIVNAEKTLNYNRKVIDEMSDFDIDNPQWSAYTNYVEGITNAPLNRLYNKTQNVRQGFNNEHEAWERTLMFLGWSQYNLNLENKKMDEIKQRTKSKKKKKQQDFSNI
jgi:hypothetical protein